MRTSILIALAASAAVLLVAIGGATASTRGDQPRLTRIDSAVAAKKHAVVRHRANDRRAANEAGASLIRVAPRSLTAPVVSSVQAAEPADEQQAADDQGDDDQGQVGAQDQGEDENEQADVDQNDDQEQAQADDDQEQEQADADDNDDEGEPAGDD